MSPVIQLGTALGIPFHGIHNRAISWFKNKQGGLQANLLGVWGVWSSGARLEKQRVLKYVQALDGRCKGPTVEDWDCHILSAFGNLVQTYIPVPKPSRG